MEEFVNKHNIELLNDLKSVIPLSEGTQCSIRLSLIIIGEKTKDNTDFDEDKKLYIRLHYSSTSINKKYPFLGYGRVSKDLDVADRIRLPMGLSIRAEKPKSDYYIKLRNMISKSWDEIQPILASHFLSVSKELYLTRYEFNTKV